MGRNIRTRMISFVIALVLFVVTIPAVAPAKEAAAATKYMRVDAFIKYIVTQRKWPVDKKSKTPYIDAAMKAGILKEGDFKDYSADLTRTDCAVLANRLDKYIYGSHYGYADEVYEFLKDCTYYDGFLYYSTKGELYPKGVNYFTYNEDRFLDEIVWPMLEPHFKFPDGLWCDYVWDGSPGFDNCFIKVGRLGKTADGVDYLRFKETDNLILAWQTFIDNDKRIKTVYDHRISDLGKIAKSKRQDVAEAVAKGIIKGYSNGKYVQNREFRGNNKITVSGAKNVVALAMDKYSRAKLSLDGQLIRITDLPINHSEYPYILECLPNEFYEVPFYFKRFDEYDNGTMPRKDYTYPIELGNKGLLEDQSEYIKYGLKPYQYFDTIMEKANIYLQKVFNVDYRTVDQKWINELAGAYAPINGLIITDEIKKYVNIMKKNHVVVESQLISLEPSSLYEYQGSYYVRAYVKYRVTADTLKVKEDTELIFSVNHTYLVGLKNGEWRYGYYDIMMSDVSDRRERHVEFGVEARVGISDGAFRGSK